MPMCRPWVSERSARARNWGRRRVSARGAVLVDRDDRRLRRADHLLRDAAEERAGEAVAAGGAHDDHLCAELLGGLDDLVPRLAAADDAACGVPALLRAFDERFD